MNKYIPFFIVVFGVSSAQAGLFTVAGQIATSTPSFIFGLLENTIHFQKTLLNSIAAWLVQNTPSFKTIEYSSSVEKQVLQILDVSSKTTLPKNMTAIIQFLENNPELKKLFHEFLRSKDIEKIHTAISQFELAKDIQRDLNAFLYGLMGRSKEINSQYHTDNLGRGLVPDVPDSIGILNRHIISVHNATDPNLPQGICEGRNLIKQRFHIEPTLNLQNWPLLTGHAGWMVHSVPTSTSIPAPLKGIRTLGLIDNHPEGVRVSFREVPLDFSDLGPITHIQGVQIMEALQYAGDNTKNAVALKQGHCKIDGFTNEQNERFSQIASKFLEDCREKSHALHTELTKPRKG